MWPIQGKGLRFELLLCYYNNIITCQLTISWSIKSSDVTQGFISGLGSTVLNKMYRKYQILWNILWNFLGLEEKIVKLPWCLSMQIARGNSLWPVCILIDKWNEPSKVEDLLLPFCWYYYILHHQILNLILLRFAVWVVCLVRGVSSNQPGKFKVYNYTNRVLDTILWYTRKMYQYVHNIIMEWINWVLNFYKPQVVVVVISGILLLSSFGGACRTSESWEWRRS